MIRKRNQTALFFILLGFFMSISLPLIHISSIEMKDTSIIDNNVEIIPKPSVWYVNENILIDNDDPDGSYEYWTWWVSNRVWCTFTGGVYYIKNVIINSGYCISIQHSNVNFVIENCTVINSDYNGIRLRDVDNGILRGNNFSNSTLNGIYILYMEWWDLPFMYEDSSNNIEIWNNTISYNSDNGINIEGRDNSLTCDNNNITGNTLKGNTDDGISIVYGDSNTIVNNTCFSNGGSGIFIDDNDGDTINENTCSFNTAYGIKVFDSDGNTINDNECNDNYHGIYVSRSDDNIINGNNANNNDEVGLYLRTCDGTQSEWSNEISGNTINTNNIGMHLYASDYTHVGTGNTVSGNAQYGIYLSEASANNKIIENIVNNNGVHDICYTSDCAELLNQYLNNGVTAVNLGGGGTGPGGFNPQYLYAILLILFFVVMLGGFGYARKKNRERMKDAGVIETSMGRQSQVVFVRPGVVYNNQPHQLGQRSSSTSYYEQEGDNKPITPKEIEPYEFYCSKCDQKSLGYQVFCPTCGERMRQPKLAAMHNPDETVQCVICHTATCSTCDHDITGDDACFEECPYCERSYHKHCWNKTMQAFGKCGFCLETPPPQLIPNAFKTQDNTYYQDP